MKCPCFPTRGSDLQDSNRLSQVTVLYLYTERRFTWFPNTAYKRHFCRKVVLPRHLVSAVLHIYASCHFDLQLTRFHLQHLPRWTVLVGPASVLRSTSVIFLQPQTTFVAGAGLEPARQRQRLMRPPRYRLLTSRYGKKKTRRDSNPHPETHMRCNAHQILSGTLAFFVMEAE